MTAPATEEKRSYIAVKVETLEEKVKNQRAEILRLTMALSQGEAGESFQRLKEQVAEKDTALLRAKADAKRWRLEYESTNAEGLRKSIESAQEDARYHREMASDHRYHRTQGARLASRCRALLLTLEGLGEDTEAQELVAALERHIAANAKYLPQEEASK